jgi:hypothetical protein
MKGFFEAHRHNVQSHLCARQLKSFIGTDGLGL